MRRHAGQLAIAGFAGRSIPQDLRLLAREFDLGGVVLFARNVEAPEQVAEMSRDAQALAEELPLWVSTDQEGGRVARLKSPFTVWPPMLTLGRSGDEQLAERFARALAAELRAVGISLDFTPVLDILTNPKNPVIGDRALAERADDVARLGAVIIRTLQAEGIAACGKHFPGHGDTSVDSHHELPVVEHPPDRIERVELVPFRAAIDADVASIMTAHVLIPSLDEERPATLSPRIIDGMLKQSLNFQGLVVTDDLEMKAISARYGTAEASVAAIAAGCDVVLLCGADQAAQVAAIEAVIHAVEERHAAGEARRRRAGAASPREGAVPGAAATIAARPGGALRDAARPRRASRRLLPRWRGSPNACANRARSDPAIALPSWRPPARLRAPNSTPASTNCDRSGSIRFTRRVCSSVAPMRRDRPRRGRPPLPGRGGTLTLPRSSRCAAATAACTCCRCWVSRSCSASPKHSSATATTPRCSPG